MDSIERNAGIIEKAMRKAHQRALLIGVGLCIALGIILGFVIGIQMSDGATVVIPLERGIDT